MSRELTDLLVEAVPTGTGGPDLDAIESRVARRRWSAGVVAVLVATGLAIGVSQLVAPQPPVPIVGTEEGAQQPSTTSGAFDRGRDELLQLDLTSPQRLQGRALPTPEGLVGGAAPLDTSVAVAADRAVGLYGTTGLRIYEDGELVASRPVVQVPDPGGVPPRAVAFDSDGTLWAWTGRGVAGLMRDGTEVDHTVAIPSVPVPDVPLGEPALPGVRQLRVTGTDVSVVFSNLADPTWVQVVPVVGDDPAAGVHEVDSPIPADSYLSTAQEVGVLASGYDSIVTPEALLGGSILGQVSVELDWGGPPQVEAEHWGWGTSARSQLVADTSASLLYTPAFDSSFLLVHRAGGLAAAALVDGFPLHISVSPDGAVHVVNADATAVTTLLDADLWPVAGFRSVATTPIGGGDTASAACGDADGPARSVDGLDLDADGAVDRVTFEQDGRIVACLADGRVTSVTTRAGLDRGATLQLQPVDLAGTDGVALVIDPDDGASSVYLLRLVGDDLGALGGPNAGTVGGRRMADAGDWHFGPDRHPTDPASPGVIWAFGCRPSASGDVDFDVAEVELSPGGQFIAVHGVRGWSLVDPGGAARLGLPAWGSPIVDVPFDQVTDADLDDLLREHGFTPRCALGR